MEKLESIARVTRATKQNKENNPQSINILEGLAERINSSSTQYEVEDVINEYNYGTSNNRKKVYDKFNGKCAYCGCDITLEKMQIDHLVPLYRNDSDEQLNELGKIRGTDNMSNLMPACPSCNHYKSTFSLEEFREQLMLLRERLNKQHKIYSISLRYGLIEEKENKVEFYFEKHKTK